MLVFGGIVILASALLGYLICSLFNRTPYDKRVSDEEQFKYIEDWREHHKDKIKE